MGSWQQRAERAAVRYLDGAARLPDEGDERQRQLTRMGNAAWAAGLSLLMAGSRADANAWLLRAAETYRRSWPEAPPGSWGRPIGAMKSRLIAGDLAGARHDAAWALEAGAPVSESPIGRYAGALALLVVGQDPDAEAGARTLEGAESVPTSVTDSLVALARGDGDAYSVSVAALVADFEGREEFLEDIAVADTVLALQALARERGIETPLESSLLPG
jgi:hypothetical protein